ncbi:MAG TPA: DMT family transporter [Symbiobacteriaceae bacterium]|nr:DMT family transporter [Symbiobacteriaceae bacterium]
MPTPYLVLLGGVLAVSVSSIMVRYTTADPLVVAFYRMLLTTLLLAPIAAKQDGLRMDRKSLRLSVLSGLFLAAHFASWFWSIRLTSIASSTILVDTHPLWVLLISFFVWRERPGRVGLGATLLALGGAVLISWGDLQFDPQALLGDLLAVVGAITVSAYFLIGQQVRKRVGALLYSVTAYGVAAVALLIAALAAGAPLAGFAPVNWALFLGLAVIPTIFGHTVFNWVLHYLPAPVVSLSILGEPVGATLMAWILFTQVPSPATLAGGALTLGGIFLYLWHQVRQGRQVKESELVDHG